MSRYPERDKMISTEPDREVVSEFMAWAERNGLALMAVDDGRPYAVNWEHKMAEWLGIDLEKLAAEEQSYAAQRPFHREG